MVAQGSLVSDTALHGPVRDTLLYQWVRDIVAQGSRIPDTALLFSHNHSHSHASEGLSPDRHCPDAHSPAAHGLAAHCPAAHCPATHCSAAHCPAAHCPAGYNLVSVVWVQLVSVTENDCESCVTFVSQICDKVLSVYV